MNFKTLIIGVVLCAGAAFGANDNGKAKLSPEERQARKDRLVMEKAGGYLLRPGTPKGKIVVYNAQKAVSTDLLKDVYHKNDSSKKCTVDFIDGDPVSLSGIESVKKRTQADFIVIVAEDKELPMSLLALEAQWGIVNVAALREGAKSAADVVSRSQVEFARVFYTLCGGYSSQFTSPIMNYIKGASDLDGKSYEVPVDTASKVLPYLEIHGVVPAKKVMYKKACLEGWAPQPTNQFQKAIWDEIHQLPTQPITIKPESQRK